LLKILWNLFFTFAKVGLFTFGGGYAMFPIMKKELIENKGWISEEELLNYYAIGQCTPGIIAVNTATFVGNKLKGFWGALISTIGIIFPSIVIITIIAKFIKNYSDLWYVQSAFSGIRVVVVLLILNTIISMWEKSIKDWFGYILFFVAFGLAYYNLVSSVLIVIICGFVGVLRMVGKEGNK